MDKIDKVRKKDYLNYMTIQTGEFKDYYDNMNLPFWVNKNSFYSIQKYKSSIIDERQLQTMKRYMSLSICKLCDVDITKSYLPFDITSMLDDTKITVKEDNILEIKYNIVERMTDIIYNCIYFIICIKTFDNLLTCINQMYVKTSYEYTFSIELHLIKIRYFLTNVLLITNGKCKNCNN